MYRIHIVCPDCLEKDSLTICGPGIERIEEETRSIFPDSKIAVISKDHSKKSKDSWGKEIITD
jgi:primosomal protein N' (replication factor Y)